jgi:hypothetical protein
VRVPLRKLHPIQRGWTRQHLASTGNFNVSDWLIDQYTFLLFLNASLGLSHQDLNQNILGIYTTTQLGFDYVDLRAP